MALTAEKLQPTLIYLEKYFAAHHREHRMMMRDAGGALYGPGREPYEGHNEIIDCIRDAVLLAEDSFSDLRIPEGFPSPKAFLDQAKAYREMLDKHAKRAEELNKSHGENWHTEISYAYKICSEIRDAVDHAITLAEIDIDVQPLKRLVNLLERLPRVSRSIAKKNRHAGRSTLEISDEYDVQDLLQGMLHLDFDDIRPEVWCPSYAGTNTRTDFLLPSEGILIEVKHTKNAHSQTKVVEELIIDIARYKTYPGVCHIVCAIWDTGHHLKNPAALKSDIEKNNDGLVTVVVMS